MFQKYLKRILRHKIVSAVVLLLLIGGGYWTYKSFGGNEEKTRYIFTKAEKSTLIISVSGSGQVLASNQVDIKAKASGEIIYIVASAGQGVDSGELLVQLDARDAQKAVRDAELNLESSRLALDKMKGRQEGNYTLRSIKEKASDDLEKAYDDGFNTVSNAFLDLPGVMSGLQAIVLGTDFGGGQYNIDYYANSTKDFDTRTPAIKKSAFDAYQTARQKYDQNFTNYKSVSRFSSKQEIESIINEVYDTTKVIAESVKSANNLIQFYKDVFTKENLKTSSLADSHLTLISGYTDKTNKHLVALLASSNMIQTDKEAIAGSDFDLESQELSVRQRENALLDAREKLDDYFIRAPFASIIAKIIPKKGESVSANSSVATIITRLQTAEISLNEVDVTHVKIGQKTTLIFDAIPGLSINGEVTEIDTVGTVSQGVVSYNIKIAFDTQDNRVKPGMSASADIITEVKTNVLMIPNSALKSQGEKRLVEIPDDEGTATKKPVEVGISNNEFTEILSGLNEGDTVITGTINNQTANSANSGQQSTGLRIPGLPDGGGFRQR